MNVRCYTTAQACEKLNLPRRTFFRLKRCGQIPCLEEIRPRLGRVARYRADLIDQYIANDWQRRSLRRVS